MQQMFFFIADLIACLSGFRAAAAVAARKPDTQPSALHHTDNLKTKAPNTTGTTYKTTTYKSTYIRCDFHSNLLPTSERGTGIFF